MAIEKNDKNNKKHKIGRVIKWIVGIILIIVFILYGMLDFILGGSLFLRIRSLFHIPETAYVYLDVEGKLFEYPIKIHEVMQCKSGISTVSAYAGGGKYWELSRPYVYQINADKSIILISLKQICNAALMDHTIHFEKNFVSSIFWFDRNEKPEQIKYINNGKMLSQLAVVGYGKSIDGTELTQKFKTEWMAFLKSQKGDKHKFIGTDYHKYFFSSIKVWTKDLWKQKNYLVNAVNGIEKMQRISIPEENRRDYNIDHTALRFPLIKSRSTITLDSEMQGQMSYNLADNTVFSSWKPSSDEMIDVSHFSFNLFKQNISIDQNEWNNYQNTECYKSYDQISPYLLYVPEQEIIIEFPCLSRAIYLPFTPVLEEIR